MSQTRTQNTKTTTILTSPCPSPCPPPGWGKKPRKKPGVSLMWMSRQVHMEHVSTHSFVAHQTFMAFFIKSGQNSLAFSRSVNSLRLDKRTRIVCTTFKCWRIVFELIKTKTTFSFFLAGARHLEHQQDFQILNKCTCSMYV